MARATGTFKSVGFLCFMMWMSGSQVRRGGEREGGRKRKGVDVDRVVNLIVVVSFPPPLPLPLTDPPLLHHDDRVRHLPAVDGHPEVGRR
jgi:hypothetical protein